MVFPSPFARLGKLLLLVFVLPFVLLIPVNVWLYYSLPPLQEQYLASYMESSMMPRGRKAEGSIRWMMKTAPKRKSEAVSREDVVEGLVQRFPLQLSASAQAAGWRGLTLSAPKTISAGILNDVLRGRVYDGVSVWWLFGKPILYTLAGVILFWCFWARSKVSWRSGQSRKGERRHGRRTRGPELSRALSFPRSGIQLQLEGESALGKLAPFAPCFCIPKRLESSHILLMGDTGAGKSSAIRQILRQVEARGDTAIVYDPAKDFIGEFYDPERGDLILNPLDARCPYWNIDQEIVRDETATTIAAAFLPDKEYEKSFFTDAPRRLLAAMLRQRMPTHLLLQWMSEPDALASIIEGTPLATLIDPKAPAQRAGVLSSLNLVADSFELLPEVSEGHGQFSTADWMKQRKRWVFLTSSPDYREKVRPLHSVWLDLFILRMQGPCEDPDAKPVWFVLDELASLNKLPQLHTAVTENRKYGNPVVLALQGRSQMEKRYGQDAEAMLSQPATKIFFKTSEPRAAKWVSESIGEVEVERLKESRSMEPLKSRPNFTMEIATKPLIMASEVAGLAPLRAFIKLENRVVPVRFRLAKKLERQAGFIERQVPARELRQELTVVPQPVLNAPVSASESMTRLSPKMTSSAAIESAPPRDLISHREASSLTPVPAAAETIKSAQISLAIPMSEPSFTPEPLAVGPATEAGPKSPFNPNAEFVWDESQGID